MDKKLFTKLTFGLLASAGVLSYVFVPKNETSNVNRSYFIVSFQGEVEYKTPISVSEGTKLSDILFLFGSTDKSNFNFIEYKDGKVWVEVESIESYIIKSDMIFRVGKKAT